MKKNFIIVRGAREHNLKNISLEIPREKFVVFTGVSGSGKSTLAFDTIFAEGQRRYLESLSAYARQFLGQMDKPEVDEIEGLSPAISIDQKTAGHNPRSTVGTITEIYDYLRLLYAKIGRARCPVCRREITPLSVDEILEQILQEYEGKKIDICSPVVRARKGTYLKTLADYWDRGFTRAYVDGRLRKLAEAQSLRLERYRKHNIDIVIDRVEVSAEEISRLFEATETALSMADGLVRVIETSGRGEKVYNSRLSCPEHGGEFPELTPALFSFNSPEGACPECDGLGLKRNIDLSLLAPDENKTVGEGALLPYSPRGNNYINAVLRAVIRHWSIPDNVRLKDLPERLRKIIFQGEEEPTEITVAMRSGKGSLWKFKVLWRGLPEFLRERYRRSESAAVRKDIEQYMLAQKCASCGGGRLRPEAAAVVVGGKTLPEITAEPIFAVREFFRDLKLTAREKIIAERVVAEIGERLGFLDNVGLGYLTLSRSGHTLSGGEAQRIRLAGQIGSGLTGVLYILDEPSIGLHARDNAKLLRTLLDLRDRGNSLIVIEHDEETIRAADFVVDIGPRAGRGGGEVVAAGSPRQIAAARKSLTGAYLRGEKSVPVPAARRKVRAELIVRGAREHNLRSLTARFGLGVFNCVTGVSGSGKSTLVEDILYKFLAKKLNRAAVRPGACREISGWEKLSKVVMIDQSPIGRTPRSNPATYTGVFTPIRQLFAASAAARERGYAPGRFSFNVAGGRCENCRGEGMLKVEMQFMPDVYLSCDVCGGSRYNSETLRVKFHGKSIADVLAMTVSEAAEFFADFPAVAEILRALEDVGLGYIHLGQSATTLSGGEAQRVKLAGALAGRGNERTIYILDEPTTGLHFDDVAKLLEVLHRLTDAGGTIVVIEHNLDVIKTADRIIDLGPEGGDRGGRVVACGTPEEVLRAGHGATAEALRAVMKS